MKIELHEIPVRDVVAGYKDSAENGVVCYNGHLNIRPAFQREFIYKDKQRDAVMAEINSIEPMIKADEDKLAELIISDYRHTYTQALVNVKDGEISVSCM